LGLLTEREMIQSLTEEESPEPTTQGDDDKQNEQEKENEN